MAAHEHLPSIRVPFGYMTDHQLALRDALESFMARRVLQRLKRDEITPAEAWGLLIERFDPGMAFSLISSAR